MTGHAGRLLHVDLTTGRSRPEPIDAVTLGAYVGGVGLGARLLMDRLAPGADPLEPDNVLVLANSALSGTLAPAASKYAIVTKSPLTGLIGDSLSGSFFAAAMRRAGWDALVITGRAPRLSYLFVDDDRAYVRDGAALAGLDAFATEEAVRAHIDDELVRVASIGLAGERLVRYACVGNDKGRQAGRTGTGAVMGSKNLKAVAIRGTRAVTAADPGALYRLALDYNRRAQGPATQKYRAPGTVGNVLMLNRLGILPTRNFQTGVFAEAEAVSGEMLAQRHTEKAVACGGCPIACDQVVKAHAAPWDDARVSLDYESLWALGPLCGVSVPDAIIKAAHLCDRYGLDTVSTGVSIAWAMECFERGLLTPGDTGGLDLGWGNAEAVIALVEGIARRAPGLGDLLADGVRRAAARVGGGSDAFAMHVKGLEFPGYEPRGLGTFALGLAVGTRGACHNRAPGYEPDMQGTVDRFTTEPSRGALVRDLEDFAAALDSLVVCKFLRKTFTDFWEEGAALYRACTGRPMTAADLRRVGERVATLKKAFNIREGWTAGDDWLPARCFDDPLPDGVTAGQTISRDALRATIDAYYAARGWTASGLIPAEKLAALGLAAPAAAGALQPAER